MLDTTATQHSRLAAFFTPKSRGQHELQRKGLVLDVGFMRPLLVWRGYWIDGENVMSGFKGTPGPWKVNVIGQHWNNKSLTHLEVTFGSDGECVCDTVYKIDDANLIAAAPKLLEALQDALHAHDKHGEYVEWDFAREAIQEALGN